MALKFQNPPRIRTNDLIDYDAAINELADAPGKWAVVAEGVSVSDAQKIVRTFRQHPVGGFKLSTATRATEVDGAEPDNRDVYVILEQAEPDAAVDPAAEAGAIADELGS